MRIGDHDLMCANHGDCDMGEGAKKMDRQLALDKADAMVAAWTEQTKNQRGYVHDKWSPVDLEARTTAVLRVAAFLLTPTGPLVAPLPPPSTVVADEWTVFGWNPSHGKPSASQLNAARAWMESRQTDPNRPVPVAEIEAVRHLLAAADGQDGRLLCTFCLQPRGEYAPDSCITPRDHRHPA